MYPTDDLRCVLTRTRNGAVTVAAATLLTATEVRCAAPALAGGTYMLEVLFDIALDVRYQAPFLLTVIGALCQ